MNIKKNDNVMVITGKDKGKKGKVLVAYPQDNRVIVEGANIATHHTKPKKQGEPGGIIKREAAIDVSNVMVICPKCGKPVRTGSKVLDDGKKVRVCRKCGAEIK